MIRVDGTAAMITGQTYRNPSSGPNSLGAIMTTLAKYRIGGVAHAEQVVEVQAPADDPVPDRVIRQGGWIDLVGP